MADRVAGRLARSGSGAKPHHHLPESFHVITLGDLASASGAGGRTPIVHHPHPPTHQPPNLSFPFLSTRRTARERFGPLLAVPRSASQRSSPAARIRAELNEKACLHHYLCFLTSPSALVPRFCILQFLNPSDIVAVVQLNHHRTASVPASLWPCSPLSPAQIARASCTTCCLRNPETQMQHGKQILW